jgi:hypothetical protein
VDKDGETRVKVECVVDEDEKEHVWDLLRFKHKRDCTISVEPSDMLFDSISKIFYAKNNQAAIVDINPENTPFSYEMDFSIRQTAAEGLLVNTLFTNHCMFVFLFFINLKLVQKFNGLAKSTSFGNGNWLYACHNRRVTNILKIDTQWRCFYYSMNT